MAALAPREVERRQQRESVNLRRPCALPFASQRSLSLPGALASFAPAVASRTRAKVRNGLIAYSVGNGEDNPSSVTVINPDGARPPALDRSGQEALRGRAIQSRVVAPSWSSDGATSVQLRLRHPHAGLTSGRTVDVSGRHDVLLATHPWSAPFGYCQPQWTPDGKRLAAIRTAAGGELSARSFVTFNQKGSGERVAFTFPKTFTLGCDFSWSVAVRERHIRIPLEHIRVPGPLLRRRRRWRWRRLGRRWRGLALLLRLVLVPVGLFAHRHLLIHFSSRSSSVPRSLTAARACEPVSSGRRQSSSAR